MATPPLYSTKHANFSNVQSDNNNIPPLDEKVYQLGQRFLQDVTKAYLIVVHGMGQRNLQDFSLQSRRQILCNFLELDVEGFQQQAIGQLKQLFRLSYLADDVKNHPFEQLIDLEKQISKILSLMFQSTSDERILSLLDLYQAILERLWLLPHITEDKSSDALFMQENQSRLLSQAEKWMTDFSKREIKDKKITAILKSLPDMLQRLCFPSSDVIQNISQVKSNLSWPFISALVGIICKKVGNFWRAIDHYQESLDLMASFKIVDSADQTSLKKQENDILNQLGFAYYSLGEYRKAIESHKKALRIAQTLEDRDSEGKAYGNLGIGYYSLGEYRKAIKFYEKHLQIAQALKDRAGEGGAYSNLGNAYQALGKYDQAIKFHEKCLQIAQELDDRAGEGKAYGNLGVAYHSRADYPKAMEYHEKALQIAKSLQDQAEEERAYGNSGNVSLSLGDYRTAIKFYEKQLQIAQALEDQAGEGAAYGNLGIAYRYMGNYRMAIEFHEKQLQIAQILENPISKGKAYGNLGSAYCVLGQVPKSIEFYEKVVQIAQTLENRAMEGIAYGNLGIAYNFLKNYSKAIDYHKKAFQIAQEIGDRAGEGRAYTNLGITYSFLGDYRKAIKFYEKCLEIAQNVKNQAMEGSSYANIGGAYSSLRGYRKAIEYHKKALHIAQSIKDQDEEAKVFNNIGVDYEHLGEFQKAEEYFHQSIKNFSALQDQLGDNHHWKITIFEGQAQAYLGLEGVLLKQNKVEEALRVTDSRQSRALVSVLSKNLNSQSNLSSSNPLTVQEMQSLAHKLQTTFLIYSFVSSDNNKQNMTAWIISSQGEIICKSLYLLPEEMKEEANEVFKTFPYKSVRPQRGQKSPSLSFQERLSQWYEALIAPIESYLPQDPRQTVTLIPDGFLSQLPFAAFQDSEGKYLIEKHPISIAPSVKVLHLLTQSPRIFSEESFIVGNPTTPDPKENNLKHTEEEVRTVIAPLLKTSSDQILTQETPTVARVIKEISQKRFIHLACHGVTGEKFEDKPDPHSIFQGLFKLAADPKHLKGYLHSHEIAFLSLRTELVFLSACHSGRGTLQREGNIGPIWSFLAAGALSTVASYWSVPDGETTVQMVETFYRHLLGIGVEKLNKAQALQKAMLMAMEKERDKPRQWAAFFLSGLHE